MRVWQQAWFWLKGKAGNCPTLESRCLDRVLPATWDRRPAL